MRKRFFAFLLVLNAAIIPLSARAQIADNNYGDTSLINQMVEQNFADPDVVFGNSFAQLLTVDKIGEANETYQGIKQFWQNDLQSQFSANISHVISDWLNQSFIGYLSATISTLSSVVKSFFLNPNLIQVANNATDLSALLNQLANIIYGVAFDLLFFLFIVAIWHYWTKASWQGNISAMSAVGRLICTIGMVIAWPIIYSFEIELSNEMISAIFANSSDQLSLLDMVMANIFKVSLYAGASHVITQIIPTANLSALGMASVGSFLSSLGWLALCILAIVLIYELIYLIVLKAIQMALLTTQYVFAPVFLIFFAMPSTEKIATSYIRTFAETSIWTFIWIGLLKILVILMYANFNPCGKILTAIGILQLMMRVPQFLGHFKISAASDFVNPGFFTSGLRERVTKYTEEMKTHRGEFVTAFKNTFGAANASPEYGNNISAEFSFAKTSGHISDCPNRRTQNVKANSSKASFAGSNQTQEYNGSLADGSHRHISTKILRDRKNSSAKQDIFARHSRPHPIRKKATGKSAPAENNIFARHYKDGQFNVSNGQANGQSVYEIPQSAAALLGSNSLKRQNLIDTASTKSFMPNSPKDEVFQRDSFSVSSFSTTRLSNLGSFGKDGAHFLSKFDLPFNRLNLAGRHAHSASDARLLTAKLASVQLGYGLASLSICRQQFALPSFSRHHQSMQGIHSANESSNLSNGNGSHSANESSNLSNGNGSHSASGSSNLSNGNGRSHSFATSSHMSTSIAKSKSYTARTRPNQSGSQPTARQKDHKTALYYPTPIYPGWQRPYYRSFVNNFSATKVSPVSSLFGNPAYLPPAHFRSYYD